MTTRTATSVIVRVTTTDKTGAERTTNYGPFLPHVGSATTSFEQQIAYELEATGKYLHVDTSIEDVYIGADESDCALRATR
ncbi:hypothetical protein HMPREF1529_03075 [Microbacterium sp. oral taxon 186 str. F0373]|uniref:hypothetical protein n=1 Tax=Microbacterium sp. oral taxon 186 TaxID=712383 RepID=UPI00034E74F0|nr:hypothetical protein [Microbacterium sp. oral taxon 186]EPD83014.1 hypothetical protein HMPREF1529_03075 [Microbacterium sp. oral taxon 186 str. F0373]